MQRSLTASATTLLEGVPGGTATESEVFDVLDRPGKTDLLVLSYRDGPDAWFQGWRSQNGDLPADVGFVHVGVTTRSAAVDRAGPDPAEFGVAQDSEHPGVGPNSAVLADAVEDPADLGRLGVAASEYLESWRDDGRETVVYLDSLTDMLEHVDVERAFQFLHVLAGLVESVDGRGYYRFDPSAHDSRTVEVVRELADSVVHLDAVSG